VVRLEEKMQSSLVYHNRLPDGIFGVEDLPPSNPLAYLLFFSIYFIMWSTYLQFYSEDMRSFLEKLNQQIFKKLVSFEMRNCAPEISTVPPLDPISLSQSPR